ncbi:AAA family ATPase [Acinetobacter baumannii]|uniref:AAA family ATPase n=2 Tax=Acinetobacter baumannii TaxID=470 RepID=UPI002447DF9E|nr:AAA family ATPase [Acinetobacter baumannii]MCG6625101.1 AAA family ATPase [Acinetobacter baumannii]MDH2481785.1 AAA family ATPase [Acinetobacter baumannii]
MLEMIVGIFLRHIKTYKGINFIPLSDGEKFCGLVGNNGIGKSTVLEALEKVFLQDKDWNINLGHNQSTDDTNVPYIVPVFLIERNKVDFTDKELELVGLIDDAVKIIQASNFPSRFTGAQETVIHFERLNSSVKNREDYFLIPLGITLKNKKSVGVFEGYLKQKYLEDKPSETDLPVDLLNSIFLKILEIYRYIYIPRELSAEEFTRLHNRQFEFLMGRSLQQTLTETISGATVRRINDSLDGIVQELEQDLESYIYKTNSDVRQTKLKRVDINNLIIEAYFNIRSMHLKVDDSTSMAITKLSSGEKQKAILDIANSLLRKNHENNQDKYVIFGFDEPESSLHISACFDMFQSLYETTQYCSQVLFTTHWYGYIPSVIRGNTVIMGKTSEGGHKFDFINIVKYREDTRIMSTQSRNQLPFSIQLKSINDLVQAIIYGSMSENPFNWLICEGSSEKIYLSDFLSELVESHRLRILPVGGYSEVKKLYNHLSIAFEDFKQEMRGKVFLLCDTDATLDMNTTNLRQDAQHPKLKYRRLIVNEGSENAELVMINSSIAANSSVLEDVLNAETFLKVLEQMEDGNPELEELIDEHKRVQLTENTYYPSALCLRLSIPEKRKLKEFFGKNNNHMKVEFALNYIKKADNKEEIPWINEIRRFFE